MFAVHSEPTTPTAPAARKAVAGVSASSWLLRVGAVSHAASTTTGPGSARSRRALTQHGRHGERSDEVDDRPLRAVPGRGVAGEVHHGGRRRTGPREPAEQSLQRAGTVRVVDGTADRGLRVDSPAARLTRC